MSTPDNPNSCFCHSCQAYVDGQIVDGPVRTDPDEPPHHYVHRRAYCDRCHHLITWLQACDKRGVVLGKVFSGPKLVRDKRAVTAFLEAHSVQAGAVNRR